ncbi:hypothetical protein C8F01DRAFT_4557 [Mycena amicta]|nr:hypothetical protein C8F01DRAFT_4557 [Mycena amicta]
MSATQPGQVRQSRWATFPPDVLGDVFLQCIPSPRGEQYARSFRTSIINRSKFPDALTGGAMFPCGMSHVCRQWRHAALGFRKLWSFIDVEQRQDRSHESRMISLLDVFLERSGQHRLTIRLTYHAKCSARHALLGRLLRHSARWETIYIEISALHAASPRSTSLDDAEWAAVAFPALKNVVLFDTCQDFADDEESASSEDGESTDSDSDGDGEHRDTKYRDSLIDRIPSSQLLCFYDYCSSDTFAAETIYRLHDVIRLRHSFPAGLPDRYKMDPDWQISMPHLQYATLEVGNTRHQVNRFLHRFHLLNIRGLNLSVGRWGHEKFFPKNDTPPSYFGNLTVLRLCGYIVMSDTALTQMFDALEQLTDLALELRKPKDYREDMARRVTKVLTPRVDVGLARCPNLQFLRMFLCDDAPNLLAMLRVRFGGLGLPTANFVPLRTFTMFVPGWQDYRIPQDLLVGLQKYKDEKGWDIRYDNVTDPWGRTDLWEEDFGGEFLLDVYRQSTVNTT